MILSLRSLFNSSLPDTSTNIVDTTAGAMSPISISTEPVVPGTKIAGIQKIHVKKYERYLGDEFYPAILTEETVRQVEAERIRREKALGRDRRKGKGAPKGVYYTGFSALKIAMKYKDPVTQAEYAYSRIRNEVSG